MAGHYSMRTNWISDLGAAKLTSALGHEWFVCAPGVLISVGAILMRRLFPEVEFSACAATVPAFGLGCSGVGLVPEDRNGQVHQLAASVHLVAVIWR